MYPRDNKVFVPTDLFSKFFRPHIRVLFDWERMEREGWPVRMQAITALPEACEWFLPWYLNANSQEVSYLDPDGSPVLLRSISMLLPCLNPNRQQLITTLAETYSLTAHQPVQVVVPLYKIGYGKSLILDCNHRLSALTLNALPFNALTFEVLGPIDSEALADLNYWTRSERNAGSA